MPKMIHMLTIILSISLASCIPKTQEEDLNFDEKQSIIDSGNNSSSNGQQVLETESQENFTVDEDQHLEIPSITIAQEWDERKIYDPQNGIAAFNNDVLNYDSFLNFSGDDNIKIEYKKNNEIVFTRNISVKINPVNDSPVAYNDSSSVAAATEIQIDVIANDTDVDEGDTITLKTVSTASNGSASIAAGKIVYQSNEAFNGTETLTYSIEDSQGATSEATLTINVTYTNGGGGSGGSGLPVVPVRIAFIEKSDGTTLTDDYQAYAQNIIDKLNETYTDGTDQKLLYVLDSYDGIVNDDYYVTPSTQYSNALYYFAVNHAISGKVNLFFVETIQGGVAGVAYLNLI